MGISGQWVEVETGDRSNPLHNAISMPIVKFCKQALKFIDNKVNLKLSTILIHDCLAQAPKLLISSTLHRCAASP
ncbi:hypothetical protein [Variovorax sp. HJSM1_2]|uniref:hypothetical protein n=1 Tax=Variovorax sp. HJSM1_2 TaxID=3366263 RepID=UPI003BE06084